MATPTTTLITFADGSTLDVAVDQAHRIAGLVEGQYGPIIVSNQDASYFYGLTTCCLATGKGSGMVESGVVCRGCYAEVSDDYGIDFPAARIIARVN